MNTEFSDPKWKNEEWLEKKCKRRIGIGEYSLRVIVQQKKIDEFLKLGDFTERRKEEQLEKECEF